MKGNSYIKGMVLVFLGVIVIYASYYAFLWCGFDDPKEPLIGVRSGTFGDAFGVLNALFSAVAFAGVMATLLIQRSDLKDAQVSSERQQEEGHFYNMLKLQQDVVSSFDITSGTDRLASGRDCFKSWDKVYRSTRKAKLGALAEDESRKEAYQVIWGKYRGDLGIYFRSLYNVLKFVSNCKASDKKWLGNVVRSLLSDYELVVLFYNCIGPYGAKFAQYAVEFEIFDNLDVSLLFSTKDLILIDRRTLGQNKEALQIYDSFKVK